MRLDDRTTAVIVGGAGGIGRGTALGLVDRSVRVVIADIEVDNADRVAAELRDGGAEAIAARVDATDEASLVELADTAEARFGSIDLLCNNVGVVLDAPLIESTEQQWAWALEFNLMSIVRACRHIVPRIRSHGRGGHVVNTASTAGLFGFPNIASYVAAKHAVVGMSQSIYHELAETAVGVSVLCPGVVTTNINTSHRNRPGTDPASVDKRTFGTDHAEAMTPAQVAGVVVEAVEADRFWILPHEHYGHQALALARTRIDGTPPIRAGTA